MIKLEDKTNIDAPDADFIYGSVRDKTVSLAGTKYNKTTMSDIFQFFEKMMAESGLVANGNLDNETNGYQLFEALFSVFPLKQKVIEIGVWDMDTTNGVDIPHGLDINKIRSVKAIIRNDINTFRFQLPVINSTGVQADIGSIDVTNVSLSRETGGFYDSVDYNDLLLNRGWIVIEYID